MNEKQAKSQAKNKKRRKVFVGGLDKRVNEQALKAYFGRYGRVERAIINREHYTDKSRGSGFVLFADAEAADRVLQETSPHILEGKMFDCQPCLLRNEVKIKKKSLNNLGYSTDNSKKSSMNDIIKTNNIKRRQFRSSIKSLSRPSESQGGNLSPSFGSSNNLEDSMFIEEKRFAVVQEQRRRYSHLNHHPHIPQQPFYETYSHRSATSFNSSSQIPISPQPEAYLCYKKPTYQPREDSFDNLRSSKSHPLNVYKNQKASKNQNCEPQNDHQGLPPRCDTPCNFDVTVPSGLDSKLMLYRPDAVRTPHQVEYSGVRSRGYPKANYVLNRGTYASFYRNSRY